MRRVLILPALILQGGAASALTLAAAPPAHADPHPPGGVSVCIDGEVEVHVGNVPGSCPRPPTPEPPTPEPPSPEPPAEPTPAPTPAPPEPTPEPPAAPSPEPPATPPPAAAPPAADPAPRPPAPRPAAAPPPAQPAPRPPRPEPRPSPSASEEVVHHTVQRTADAGRERRNPLSTSLVLVVIAVVVSAGTAIAFAR
ncbi:hypothetical protein [Actinomadura sp. WMMB 499]|uniref:hypothetical protein n=1 Tax=Actinomadura sp. WMMB 499 TaxID=1219491 RepID=UPI0012492F8B|nr:hypothetical protein [Actinomadura sp. WMMB 499]QFG19860.1 hypothetical protein F7P10_00400 [Actinomadura sp. WMMB 499]